MITVLGTKQKEETLGMIAQAWDNAREGDEIEIVQPNDLGGKSLEKLVLKNFPDASSDSRNKSRHIIVIKGNDRPAVVDEWLGHTKLRYVEETGFYSMPGLFGWHKIDVGSALLLAHLPPLKGKGADFGCGYGYLAKNILLKNEKIKILYCFDCDNRSVEACLKNVDDGRAVIDVGDCSRAMAGVPLLDFIVMNPPFHEGAEEDQNLGQRFIEAAAHHLRRNGELWMVANRHLPYEKILEKTFFKVEKIVEEKGFKIFKALK